MIIIDSQSWWTASMLRCQQVLFVLCPSQFNEYSVIENVVKVLIANVDVARVA